MHPVPTIAVAGSKLKWVCRDATEPGQGKAAREIEQLAGQLDGAPLPGEESSVGPALAAALDAFDADAAREHAGPLAADWVDTPLNVLRAACQAYRSPAPPAPQP